MSGRKSNRHRCDCGELGPCKPVRGIRLSLNEIVSHYITHRRAGAQAELDYFRDQRSLEQAIELAAQASGPHGKFSHQWRVPNNSLQTATEVLIQHSEQIKACRTFNDLHNLVEELIDPIPGIGVLTVYDTALRIGARMDRHPTEVYLHAGTLEGAKALGINPKQKFITIAALPREFERLQPREIEDCLCIYKDQLAELNA